MKKKKIGRILPTFGNARINKGNILQADSGNNHTSVKKKNQKKTEEK